MITQEQLKEICKEAGNGYLDEHSKIILALYLQLGAVKAIMEKHASVIEKYFNDETDAMAEKITAIATEVVGQQPPWLMQWMQLCASELEQEATYYSSDLHEDILCRRIFYSIHQFLGLSESSGLLLYCATRRVLTQGILR